jgi:biopolymer transport protein ExbB
MSSRENLVALAAALLAVWALASSAMAQNTQPGAAAAPAEAPAATAPAEAAAAAAAETPMAAAAETPVAAGALEPGGPRRELTMGQAFLLKLKQGGWTMVFLFLASVAGVASAIERLVNLRMSVIAPKGLAERADMLWRAGRYDEIEALPEKSNSTLARVLAVVARHRRSSMADVSMMAGDVASRDVRRHIQKAYALAVVATISPLLGLFGTVIGMIGAFDKVAAAGALGDASLLGGDISKALITTAAGLTIAMPALVLYHYFKSRTNIYAVVLEEEVGELISAWYAAEADRARPGRETRDED